MKNENLEKDIMALKEALKKIEQMSDCGSYELAIVRMKEIATKALNNDKV